MKIFKLSSDFNKAIKNMVIFPILSKSWQNQLESHIEVMEYLAFCGIKVTEEVIEEIKKISTESPLSFKNACHVYVNRVSDETH